MKKHKYISFLAVKLKWIIRILFDMILKRLKPIEKQEWERDETVLPMGFVQNSVVWVGEKSISTYIIALKPWTFSEFLKFFLILKRLKPMENREWGRVKWKFSMGFFQYSVNWARGSYEKNKFIITIDMWIFSEENIKVSINVLNV